MCGACLSEPLSDQRYESICHEQGVVRAAGRLIWLRHYRVVQGRALGPRVLIVALVTVAPRGGAQSASGSAQSGQASVFPRLLSNPLLPAKVASQDHMSDQPMEDLPMLLCAELPVVFHVKGSSCWALFLRRTADVPAHPNWQGGSGVEQGCGS